MASESTIQQFVHKLEEGGWAKWIRRAVLWAAVAWVIHLWMFKESGFRGLSHEKGIEQAQIAREIARGNGFSTKMIRPAALWQFHTKKGSFPLEQTPDTYHAPLNPFINSFFLRLTRDTWTMTPKDVSYLSDKVIAGVQLAFFLLGVLVSYLTAKRLFDKRLALLGAGLLLVCQPLWNHALSGLPQMLLLFLFSSAAYVIVRAVEARYAGQSTLRWAVALGALFGLLALGHALTIFLFVGALVFAAIFFLPRGRDAAIMLAVFALCYSPWLVRNYQVCGNPLGVGWYSGLHQIRGSESQVMRAMALEGPLKGVVPAVFGEKIRAQVITQFSEIHRNLGQIIVAPVFFLALLHLFKRPETAVFRWCIFSMWVCGLAGMAIFGIDSQSFLITPTTARANDLHALFIPLMTFYGLALVLVLWSRLEITFRLVRVAFFTIIYVASALPFLSQLLDLLSAPKGRVQWPPYVPPYISLLGQWTTDQEILMSDMPWAVAWYADRKSLWLPMTIADFTSLNDYNMLGGAIVGLYLTPVSGNHAFLHDIVDGEFKEWAPFIMRQVNVRDFPLRAVTALPILDKCIFYADRDRWSTRED